MVQSITKKHSINIKQQPQQKTQLPTATPERLDSYSADREDDKLKIRLAIDLLEGNRPESRDTVREKRLEKVEIENVIGKKKSDTLNAHFGDHPDTEQSDGEDIEGTGLDRDSKLRIAQAVDLLRSPFAEPVKNTDKYEGLNVSLEDDEIRNE